MTDEEIIKALKCCSRGNCKDCAAKECTDLECVHNLSQNALRLINDQQEKIESMVFKFSEEQMDDMVKRVLKSVEFDIDGIKCKAYEQLINKVKTADPKALLKFITDLTKEN